MPDHLAAGKHPHGPTGPPTDDRPTPAPSRSGWGLVALALLPIACCGLPLLLTALTAASAGVVIGGSVGAALLVIAGVVAGLAIRRRRAGLSR